MAGADAIRIRRAGGADAEPLPVGIIAGVEDCPSFAPSGWPAPSFDAELKHVREALTDADVYCLVAESGSGLVGQITLLLVAHA